MEGSRLLKSETIRYSFTSWLWRTPGWSTKYPGQMAAFLTSLSLTPCFVLFSSFKIWFILEPAELVHVVLLRVDP